MGLDLGHADLAAALIVRYRFNSFPGEDLACAEGFANRGVARHRIGDAIRQGATLDEALAAAPGYDGASLWHSANQMVQPDIPTMAPHPDMVDALADRLAELAPSAEMSPGLWHRYGAELHAARGNGTVLNGTIPPWPPTGVSEWRPLR